MCIKSIKGTCINYQVLWHYQWSNEPMSVVRRLRRTLFQHDRLHGLRDLLGRRTSSPRESACDDSKFWDYITIYIRFLKFHEQKGLRFTEFMHRLSSRKTCLNYSTSASTTFWFMIDWQSGSMWSGLYQVLHLKQVDSSWLPQHNKTRTHLMHLRVAEQHLMQWWHGDECHCGRSRCNILHCKLRKH